MQFYFKQLFLWVFILGSLPLLAQFTLSSEFRFNPLYSRGFRKTFTETDNPGAYIHQRSRLISEYKKEKDLEINLTIQDWRVWGDQNERKDIAELSLFRGYVHKWLTPKLSIKAGRQGLSYDDKHLFGGRNWGGKMAHDAAVLMYEDSTFKSHLILAYNANGWEYNREAYNYNFYKSLQTLWLHKDWSKSKLSFIFVNRGLDKNSNKTIQYNQTTGLNLHHKFGNKLAIKAIYYYQFGRDTARNTINANFISIQAKIAATQKLGITLGMDRGSGTDANKLNDPNNKTVNTFDRLYGLIHGHFGAMDYFYTKFNVPGTTDFYTKFKYKINDKWSVSDDVHAFMNSADVADPTDNTKMIDPFLGMENDITFSYKLDKDIKISIGHSIFFKTPSLEKTVFGGTSTRDNQFAFCVITVNPTFFTIQN